MFLVESGFAQQTGNDPGVRMSLLKESFQNNHFEKLASQGITHVFMVQSQLSLEKEKTLINSGFSKVFSNQGVAIFAMMQ